MRVTLLLTSAAVGAAAAAGDLDLLLLDTGKYPTAICNDGSPAGFYFRKGTSNDWLVLYVSTRF